MFLNAMNLNPSAEISAWISEQAFGYLDAPVKRVASLDTAIPFTATLENNFLPKGRLKAAIEDVMGF